MPRGFLSTARESYPVWVHRADWEQMIFAYVRKRNWGGTWGKSIIDCWVAAKRISVAVIFHKKLKRNPTKDADSV
ncbi:hypothetical protein KL905_000288 [Ogataea polymorpha]|nr:hypothetical protein KL936_001641 [Ogataea polymorpha]KAG7895051.1 hypothetical protein KL908_001401 [Ogataea polymorpha]KAG7912621.1 hypothetical protein KL907_000823 [Ogataea polymorpha]KAG7924134.1 hypothetical protein KL905_000288 [Ogataea polymorpha]KAG7928342.1 hypothetical protein KL925_001642 [Ogataea polymorpha]